MSFYQQFRDQREVGSDSPRYGRRRNLINSASIQTNWRGRILHQYVTKFYTATRYPMKLEGPILRHLCIGNLRTRRWYEIAPFLAKRTLLGTFFNVFNDRFIHGISLAERKVELWHGLPVAILSSNQQWEKKTITKDVCFANPNDEHNSDKEDSSCARIAWQVLLMPNTQH